jgi:hypothetical protein
LGVLRTEIDHQNGLVLGGSHRMHGLGPAHD